MISGTLHWHELTEAQQRECYESSARLRWRNHGATVLARVRGAKTTKPRRKRRTHDEVVLERRRVGLIREAKKLARLGLVEEGQKLLGIVAWDDGIHAWKKKNLAVKSKKRRAKK